MQIARMATPHFFDLGSFTGTGPGTAVDVGYLEQLAGLIGGTFVGTIDIEASFDGGTTFVPIPGLDGQTAPTIVDIPFRCDQIRGNCTAYTSGTIEAQASGSNQG